MKKIISIFYIIFLSFAIYSQETQTERKYIDGYENLPWGSSVENVKEKYPFLSRDMSADCSKGEVFYSDYSSSVVRYFRFFNNKLYWVRVIYNDISQTQFDALVDKLVLKYGSNFYDIDSDDQVKFGYKWMLFTDLSVELSVNNSVNGFGVKLGEWVGVTYYSYSIFDEMEKAEIDNIEL